MKDHPAIALVGICPTNIHNNGHVHIRALFEQKKSGGGGREHHERLEYGMSKFHFQTRKPLKQGVKAKCIISSRHQRQSFNFI